MDLLTIQHQDFTMYVECTKFDGIWNKAKRFQNGNNCFGWQGAITFDELEKLAIKD